MTKQVPAQNPQTSKQDVGTPKEFLDAVEKRFGKIIVDLAAHKGNHVVDTWCGPGGIHKDSLSVSWEGPGLLWLNPPFGDIPAFVENCAKSKQNGAKIAVLLPMALETKWYKNFVYRQAWTLILKPRLKFVGHKNVFPKGLILAYYDNQYRPKQDIELWDWKKDVIH